MRPIFLCYVAVFICLFPAITSADDYKDDLLNELYEKSGLEVQVKHFPELIMSGFDMAIKQQAANNQTLPVDNVNKIKELISDYYAPDIMKNAVLKSFEENLSIEIIQAVLNWLNSNLGGKCTLLEEKASTPEAFVAMQQYAQNLQNSPPSGQRIEIIKKFDESVRATESSVNIAMNTQFGIRTAVASIFQPVSKEMLTKIAEGVDKNRQQIKSAVQPVVMVSLLYTYQSLSDNELGEYIDFAASESGKKYHDVTVETMQAAFRDASFNFGLSMTEALMSNSNKQNKI